MSDGITVPHAERSCKLTRSVKPVTARIIDKQTRPTLLLRVTTMQTVLFKPNTIQRCKPADYFEQP